MIAMSSCDGNDVCRVCDSFSYLAETETEEFSGLIVEDLVPLLITSETEVWHLPGDVSNLHDYGGCQIEY